MSPWFGLVMKKINISCFSSPPPSPTPQGSGPEHEFRFAENFVAINVIIPGLTLAEVSSLDHSAGKRGVVSYATNGNLQ